MSIVERLRRADEAAAKKAKEAQEAPEAEDVFIAEEVPEEPVVAQPKEDRAAVIAAREQRAVDRQYMAHAKLAELKGEPVPDRASFVEQKKDAFQKGQVIEITDGKRNGKITVVEKMKIKSEEGHDRYRVRKENGDEVLLTEEQMKDLQKAAELGLKADNSKEVARHNEQMARVAEMPNNVVSLDGARDEFNRARMQAERDRGNLEHAGYDPKQVHLKNRYEKAS